MTNDETRMTRRTLVVGGVILTVGCTHRQLADSTVATAATTMDIQYQMVLENLARLADDPGALPSHIRIKDGTVQVSDDLGLYNLTVPTSVQGGELGGFRAQRTVAEQWGADAVNDPRAVKQLQDLYRTALGLPVEPDPPYLFPPSTRPSTSQPTLDRLDLRRDVPTGFFHLGTSGDVPAAARFVGRHGERYVWVLPADVPAFSRFTLAILFVTKLGPGEKGGPPGGLMVTTGGR